MPEFILDREGERQSIRQRLAKRRPFLIHGPTGVGKTLLLRSLLPEFQVASVLREMPVFDHGQLTFSLRRPALLALVGRKMSELFVTKRLTALIGTQLTRSLSAHCALLCDWSERTLGQVQRRFDAYANSYRAQVERLLGNQEMRTGQDEDAIRRDLESLENTLREKTLAS